jgi:hypothetical protein
MKSCMGNLILYLTYPQGFHGPPVRNRCCGCWLCAFNVTVSCLSVTARQERMSTKPSRIRKAVIVCGISRVWSWVVAGFLGLLFYFNNTLFSQVRNDYFLNNEGAKMTQAYYIYIMVILPLLLYSCVFMFMLVGWDSISELVSQFFAPRCIWVWRYGSLGCLSIQWRL